MSEKKLDIQDVRVKVLAINASNRKNSNSRILLEKAVEALEQKQNVEVQTLHTFNKHSLGTERKIF